MLVVLKCLKFKIFNPQFQMWWKFHIDILTNSFMLLEFSFIFSLRKYKQ